MHLLFPAFRHNHSFGAKHDILILLNQSHLTFFIFLHNLNSSHSCGQEFSVCQSLDSNYLVKGMENFDFVQIKNVVQKVISNKVHKHTHKGKWYDVSPIFGHLLK